MARERDEAKRTAILETSKKLFAEKGYHGTSISDIIKELDIPAGTIYTYFKSKDHILITAIEEGWEDFMSRLEEACSKTPEPEKKLETIVTVFLPELFSDTELITLILTDGVRFINLADKLNKLSYFIANVLADIAQKQGTRAALAPKDTMAALTIFFLGTIDTVRLIQKGIVPLKESDVVNFIKLMIQSGFNITM